MSRRWLAALLACCLEAAAQTPAPVWPGAQWQHAAPEEMGMDSRALAQLVEYGSGAQMDSLVVTRHGKVVAEAYYAPFRADMKHRVNSATKSVVSALAGIASGQGLLGKTDTPVLDLLADRPVANVDARKKAMTVQTLLDMTSGLDWTEPLSSGIPETMIAAERSPDWVQFILDRPMAQAPGQGFNYNSGNAHLVSALIASRSGRSTEDFAAQHLFKPLGITDFRWRRDPQGVAIGGYGLYLHTTDMARIGYLYLHHGVWNGVQVVPRAWVDKVFAAPIPMGIGGLQYGDSWWALPQRKAYMAVGLNRQLIVVLPDLGVVAAATGRANYPLEDLVDQLRASVKSEQALPPDPRAQAALQDGIRAVASTRAAPLAMPALAREISGKTYRLGPNEWGWKEITLRLEGDAPSYHVVSYASRDSGATRAATLPLGMDGGFAVATTALGVIASRGHWLESDTLRVAVRLPEEGLFFNYRLRFEGTRVEIVQAGGDGPERKATGETVR